MSQSDLSRKNQFKLAGAAALTAGLIALVVYLLTMSKSLGWHDSSELALVAWQLAASHAPGSPLHSLLGYMSAQMFAQAFIGTTLLSVLAATVAAGALAFIATVLTGDILISVCAALLYAFSYQVWTSAVITEVYSLGMMFLAIAMVLAWIWQNDQAPRHLIWMTVFYALSLAAYFANILLLPVFCIFIFLLSAARMRSLIVFLAISACTIIIIAYANFRLAQIAPPFGEINPDSFGNLFLYITGSQHNPLELDGFAHIAGRFWQHGKLFASSVLFISVPAALWGMYLLAKTNRTYSLFLILIFAIYFVYYTVFGPGDYYMMVLPAYFVFSVCVACGLAGLRRRVVAGSSKLFIASLPLLLVAGLTFIQFNSRYAFAAATEAEQFVDAAFAELPENAVAIVSWKEFSTLRYMQKVVNLRPDIRVIVPARSPRSYDFSAVSDYLIFVTDEICSAPIYTTKALAELPSGYSLAEPVADSSWRKINLSAESFAARCSQEQN
jgi:hypothetical protein